MGRKSSPDARLRQAAEYLGSPTPFLPRDLAGVLAHWLGQVEQRRAGHVPVCLLYTSPSPRDS